MRDHSKIRTRTMLLAILSALLLAYGVSFYLSQYPKAAPPEEPASFDFLLATDVEPGAIEYPRTPKPKLPVFDTDENAWLMSGKPIPYPVNLLQGFELDAHGSFPFFAFELADDASVGDYHRAVASLASHGICRVGAYNRRSTNEFAPVNTDHAHDPSRVETVDVPIYQVLEIKAANGKVQPCRERFPAWYQPGF